MKNLILILTLLSVAQADDNLLRAITHVESGGDNSAIGDGGLAYGSLQIHKGVVLDVNRVYGTSYTHRDAFDRASAVDLFHKYLAIYAIERRLGRTPTAEDKARIWNGGPNGFRKSATLGYWSKVKRALTVYTRGR
jgi:hypothetical protein